MIYDYLIVGQGIAGSMLAYHAGLRGKSFVVIDQWNPDSASNLATGVINPVTGRKMHKSWMIDKVLPYAKQVYRQIESEFQIDILKEQSVFRLLSSEDDVRWWNEKKETAEYKNYLGDIQTLENTAILQPFGTGEIRQACWVNVPVFIKAFREKLRSGNILLEERFDHSALQSGDIFDYRGIRARHVIFCEGFRGTGNPFFPGIPLSHAKGEQIEFIAPALKCAQLLNKNLFILPLGGDRYLAGSTFAWNDTTENITAKGREEILAKLRKMIRVPFEVAEEKAGIRPTITDRRPVLGASKKDPRVFLFNGLGTKGISLSPYFSAHLLDYIENNIPIIPEADICRFD